MTLWKNPHPTQMKSNLSDSIRMIEAWKNPEIQDPHVPDAIVEGQGMWKARLLKFDTLSSTNTWAMQHMDFVRHGDVVWALHQTKGKGRLERSWVAPANRGLTFSVVLFYSAGTSANPVLGQTAAVAIHQTLEKHRIQSQLKWPNDVMVKDRKIAGTLTESHRGRNAVVLGIGVNVNLTQKDINAACFDRPSTSMHIETGESFSIHRLLEDLICALEKMIEAFNSNRISRIFDLWQPCDYLAGNFIEIQKVDGKERGKYAGLDGLGRLRMIDDQGREKVFWSGDVKKIIPME